MPVLTSNAAGLRPGSLAQSICCKSDGIHAVFHCNHSISAAHGDSTLGHRLIRPVPVGLDAAGSVIGDGHSVGVGNIADSRITVHCDKDLRAILVYHVHLEEHSSCTGLVLRNGSTGIRQSKGLVVGLEVGNRAALRGSKDILQIADNQLLRIRDFDLVSDPSSINAITNGSEVCIRTHDGNSIIGAVHIAPAIDLTVLSQGDIIVFAVIAQNNASVGRATLKDVQIEVGGTGDIVAIPHDQLAVVNRDIGIRIILGSLVKGDLAGDVAVRAHTEGLTEEGHSGRSSTTDLIVSDILPQAQQFS